MRQTLFFIPHQIAGLPVFGPGWLLLIWVGFSITLLIVLWCKHGWHAETRSFLSFAVLVGMAIRYVLPHVEVGQQGLPIRGYGVMLLIATVLGVLLAIHRAKQVGLQPDIILSLAFHMFIGGIVGARLFYVIQYWDMIRTGSLVGTLANIVNFVEGGLVVYGSLVGGLVAGLWFTQRQRLSALAIADLIAPSLALGLAIGRVGCLMNGCCYGGVCDHRWAISFPSSSPPYYDQHRSGLLYGFRVGADGQGRPIVVSVKPDGPAAASNLPVGARIFAIDGSTVDNLQDTYRAIGGSGGDIALSTEQGDYRWSIGALPQRTLPVHPTQIYSSMNAVILCLVTYAFFPFRRRDGEVFALLLGIYAVTRFLLEVIRTDERGLWGTGLTISQNVSLAILVGVVGLLIYLSRQPKGSSWGGVSVESAG